MPGQSPKGTHARKAAGKIHSDIERGFIRAEVVAYEDFIAYGSEAKCKEAGKLRLEGKDYVVQDGDIAAFSFCGMNRKDKLKPLRKSLMIRRYR